MIEVIKRRLPRENVDNVIPRLGTDDDPKLPVGALDAVLIVDAYHEMSQPVAMLRAAAKALKPDGRLGIVEFTMAGGGPGPEMDERVDPERVIREAKEAGLRPDRPTEHPPLQLHAGVRQAQGARGAEPRAPGEMSPVPAFFAGYQSRVDEVLQRLVVTERGAIERSMAHTLFAPSKRVRPVLTQLSAELCGGTAAHALAAAAAMELVHTSSLILDDLPAMDNADAQARAARQSPRVRRGDRDPRRVRVAEPRVRHARAQLRSSAVCPPGGAPRRRGRKRRPHRRTGGGSARHRTRRSVSTCSSASTAARPARSSTRRRSPAR